MLCYVMLEGETRGTLCWGEGGGGRGGKGDGRVTVVCVGGNEKIPHDFSLFPVHTYTFHQLFLWREEGGMKGGVARRVYT